MADVTWTKMGEITLGNTDNLAAAEEASLFIMSRMGLSLVTTSGTQSSTSSLSKYCRHGATGRYIVLDVGNGRVGASGVERKADGSFGSKSNAYFETYSVQTRPNNLLTFESLSLGSMLTAYRIYSGSGDGFVWVQFTAIDYFTNEQRVSLFGNSVKNGIYLPRPNSDELEIVEFVPIGGGSYPTSVSVTVAAPVMLKTNTFYGYMESQSCLYTVNDAEGSLGSQIQIAGTTFTCIGGSYYVR